jgi:hypothetical protein
MTMGYKLRLPDGSEIGPLDLEEVKTWYRRRLVTENSLVMKPGGAKWIPLNKAIPVGDLRGYSQAVGPSPELWAAARAAAAPRPPGAAPARAASARRKVETESWRTIVGGALLLLAAAGSAYWAFFPERWIPALDDAPWREIALAELALGLLLIRGWEPARKVARLLLLLAAAALILVAGILVAQQVPREGVLVVASAFVFLFGLVAWLASGYLSRWQVALRLLVVLAGAAGVVRFGLVAQRSDAGRVRELALRDHRFHDPAKGVTLDLPATWVALTSGQDVVQAPPGSWLVLAQPRLGGRATLASDTPQAVLSSDSYLSRAIVGRGVAGRTDLGRSDVLLGSLRGRQALGRFEKDGESFLDVVVVAKDGRTYWSLTGWIPDDGSMRPARELEALVAGFELQGLQTSRLAAAVRAATDEVPLLTPSSAEVVMAAASAPVLDPPRALRRALELAGRGRATLHETEAQELDALEAAAYGILPKPERGRLLAYIAKVRANQAGNEDEDRAMAPLVKRAVLTLPSAERLGRLQALYEKAIRAGAKG